MDWEKEIGIFPRTQVELSVPVGRRTRYWGRSCRSSPDSLKTIQEIASVCQRLSKKFKKGPHPRTIHNKHLGRIIIPDSFFGNDMVVRLVEERWAEKEADAIFLCEQIMLRHNIIKPVFPFITGFHNSSVLYSFTVDCVARFGMPDPERDSCCELATNVCEQWMCEQREEQQRRGTRRRSSVELGRYGSSYSRRSSNNSSDQGSADKNTVLIPGDLLIRKIAASYKAAGNKRVGEQLSPLYPDQDKDKGSPSLRMADLMLRHGYIRPCLKNPDDGEELALKQAFHAQDFCYQFNEDIVKSLLSRKLKLKGPQLVGTTLDRRSSAHPKTEGTHSIRMKAHALERLDSLDRPLYFSKPATIGEHSVMAGSDRRLSSPSLQRGKLCPAGSKLKSSLFGPRKVSR